MRYTVNGFTGTDAVLVISIRIGVATINILQELPALPGQRGGTDDEIKEYIYKGFDIHQIARAMRSDINLVAIKVAELNRQGYGFRTQEIRNNFLK